MYKLINAVWEITLSCNISCLHCGFNADINKIPNELSTAEALNLIEQLADLGGICADCKYGGICRGGCSEKAATYTGQLHNQPFCLYDMEKRGLV